ncbi:DUF3515 family protein [Canibacter sp. lx-72]|uniref:DUF3515 family protein n=1 Tax=Canibacter zhuwentaonis TaxID=2837491 RepID=UPI001BDDC096|nr:DUF3515 family protein [Canibacter zhuwentaonis]
MAKKTLFSLCAAALIGLSGCTPSVPVEAAADANNPLCAEVTVRLPDTLAKLTKRSTTSQATGAWGNPAAVIARCGLPPTAPTVNACISVNDVDWVVDDSQKPRYRFTAYGREPGLEIFVESEKVSGTDALLDISEAVKQLPQKRRCLNHRDTLDADQLQQTDESTTAE